MKLEEGSPALRQAIIKFLWGREDLIVAYCPRGYNILLTIDYSFATSERPGRVLVSVEEKLETGANQRIEAAHQRKIGAAIARFIRKQSDLIMSKCPPGHVLAIKVEYEFVANPTEIRVWVDYNDTATGGTMDRWIVGLKKAKLEPSDEPFTAEHFDAILQLRLPEAERNFIEFFWWRSNKPASLEELEKSFRALKRIRSLNKICFLQGLWLQCRQTRPGKYQFVVMQEVRRTPKTSRRDKNRALYLG